MSAADDLAKLLVVEARLEAGEVVTFKGRSLNRLDIYDIRRARQAAELRVLKEQNDGELPFD